MSALTQEQRERLWEWMGGDDEVHVAMDDLRALLADSDALAAAERERDEARAHVAQVEDALYACFIQLLTWFKTVDGDDWGGVAMQSTDFALRLAERAMPSKCVRAALASLAPEPDATQEDK